MVLGRSDPGLVLTGREDTIRTIRQLGRRGRQKGSSYTERSPFGFAATISRDRARHESRSAQQDFLSQQTKTDLACSILNKTTRLGKPDGSRTTWATSAAQNEKTHLIRIDTATRSARILHQGATLHRDRRLTVWGKC